MSWPVGKKAPHVSCHVFRGQGPGSCSCSIPLLGGMEFTAPHPVAWAGEQRSHANPQPSNTNPNPSILDNSHQPCPSFVKDVNLAVTLALTSDPNSIPAPCPSSTTSSKLFSICSGSSTTTTYLSLSIALSLCCDMMRSWSSINVLCTESGVATRTDPTTPPPSPKPKDECDHTRPSQALLSCVVVAEPTPPPLQPKDAVRITTQGLHRLSCLV